MSRTCSLLIKTQSTTYLVPEAPQQYFDTLEVLKDLIEFKKSNLCWCSAVGNEERIQYVDVVQDSSEFTDAIVLRQNGYGVWIASQVINDVCTSYVMKPKGFKESVLFYKMEVAA